MAFYNCFCLIISFPTSCFVSILFHYFFFKVQSTERDARLSRRSGIYLIIRSFLYKQWFWWGFIFNSQKTENQAPKKEIDCQIALNCIMFFSPVWRHEEKNKRGTELPDDACPHQKDALPHEVGARIGNVNCFSWLMIILNGGVRLTIWRIGLWKQMRYPLLA